MGAHEPNPEAKAGICYVETKSLDGETNLKIRQAIRPAIGRVSSPQDAASLKGRVKMEHPNKLIDNFDGTIELEGDGGRERFVCLFVCGAEIHCGAEIQRREEIQQREES